MAYELGSLFNKEYFFLAPGDDSLRRLLPLLKRQGVHEYTYISDPRDPLSMPPSLRNPGHDEIKMKGAVKNNGTKDEFLLTQSTIE